MPPLNGFSEAAFNLSTLVDLLSYRALHQPEQRTYTFLLDGEVEEVYLTNKELGLQARSIGARLQNLGAKDKCVLLLYRPGLEFIAAFFGCLYCGAIAVPVYPPNPVRVAKTLSQLRAIVKDTQTVAAMTTSSMLTWLTAALSTDRDFQTMHWVATDNIASDWAEKWQEPGVNGKSLAYLQYTSGTTTTPRGVMITHGNALYNSALIQQHFEHTPNCKGVIWLPPYHDMGLVGGILQPLYAGFPVTLMSPLAFLQQPYRWLHAISRLGATTSGGPNFAYDLCVRKVTPQQRVTLDLSSWDMAFNGAEPIRHETLERFVATFEPCGFRRQAFYPCYGLAEGTLVVSGGLKAMPPNIYAVQRTALEQGRVVPASDERDSNRTLVSCGGTVLGQKIVVVDSGTLTLCQPDQIGEIWVSGPSIADGYWKRPDDTDQVFRAYISGTREGPFLRTGDLGFLKDGELFITGRIKDVIIIDGRNHYPQDIELTVETSHPAIRPSGVAAFSADLAGEERLIIATEINPRYRPGNQQEGGKLGFDSGLQVPLQHDAITKAIRQAVAKHHDVTVYAVSLLKIGGIPKTPSGKVQRHICRVLFLAGSFDLAEE